MYSIYNSPARELMIALIPLYVYKLYAQPEERKNNTKSKINIT